MEIRLDAILEELEWTQGDLATKVGTARTHINALVNGKKLPTIETALRIAKAVDRHVEDIWVV
jgi:putative transcriptional regulator